jgi:4-amino-4-deoxy-L-arabinose transferase-like glycosyltransferase
MVQQPEAHPPDGALVRRGLLILTAICAVTYFLGLTTHGLTNWQEGQRALVAHDMQSRGEWIVPTVNGEPYLAKPPAIYWCQLALAKVRGLITGDPTVQLFDLRLTVALAAWLGVLATYLLGRLMLRREDEHPDDARVADRAALLGAAMLATGPLYVRSGRIGELDILIAPFTVAAIGCVFIAWRRHERQRRTHWLAVGGAVLASCAAMLTKGPPALVAIACGAFGGMAIWYTAHAGGGIGRKTIELIKALSRTHPVFVLGLPFVAMLGWSWLVAQRLGGWDAVTRAASGEAGENLRMLTLQSPLRNLEAMSYAAGLGSVACLAAVIWLLKDRPKMTRSAWMGGWVIVAWVALSFVVFSAFGKGVPRYLTPIWPGMALLGAMWIAQCIRHAPFARRLVRLLWIGVAILAVGQSTWYGLLRERLYEDRSPRAMMRELRAAFGRGELEVGTLDIWDPRLDYDLGQLVEVWTDLGPVVDTAGVDAKPVEELLEHLRTEDGAYILIIRETPHPSMPEERPPIDRLALKGFVVETLPLTSEFTIDNQRTPVTAVRVSARP